MRKVELSVMKPWIAKKVIELLGFEDEVVIEYVCGLLEDAANPVSNETCFQVTRHSFACTADQFASYL